MVLDSPPGSDATLGDSAGGLDTDTKGKQAAASPDAATVPVKVQPQDGKLLKAPRSVLYPEGPRKTAPKKHNKHTRPQAHVYCCIPSATRASQVHELEYCSKCRVSVRLAAGACMTQHQVQVSKLEVSCLYCNEGQVQLCSSTQSTSSHTLGTAQQGPAAC